MTSLLPSLHKCLFLSALAGALLLPVFAMAYTAEEKAEAHIQTEVFNTAPASIPAIGNYPGSSADGDSYVACQTIIQCKQYYFDYLVFYYNYIGGTYGDDRTAEFLTANPGYQFTLVYSAQGQLEVGVGEIVEDEEVLTSADVLRLSYDRLKVIAGLGSKSLAELQVAVQKAAIIDSIIMGAPAEIVSNNAMANLYYDQAHVINAFINLLDQADPNYVAKAEVLKVLFDQTNAMVVNFGGEPYQQPEELEPEPPEPSEDSYKLPADQLDTTYGDYVAILELAISRIQELINSGEVSPELRVRYQTAITGLRALLQVYQAKDPSWHVFAWERVGVKSNITGGGIDVGLKGFSGTVTTDANEVISATIRRDRMSSNSMFSGSVSLHVDGTLRESASRFHVPKAFIGQYIGSTLTDFLLGNEGFENSDYRTAGEDLLLDTSTDEVYEDSCSVPVSATQFASLVNTVLGTSLKFDDTFLLGGTQIPASQTEIWEYYNPTPETYPTWFETTLTIGDNLSASTTENFKPPKCYSDETWEASFGGQ